MLIVKKIKGNTCNKNIGKQTTIFPVIDIIKKNDQSSVFDADQEMTTLGSKDNAGNSVNFVSATIHVPTGLDSFVCIGDR